MDGKTAVLTLTTLGSLDIKLNGDPIDKLASRKAEGLLVYLACNPQPQPRDILATLLWDDRPQNRALGNLSVLLSSLRKQLGPFLVANRQTIGLVANSRIQVDALAFSRACSTSAEEYESLSLYTGDFLAGFHIRQASGFEEWTLLERERLQRLAIERLQTAVSYHQAQQRWSEAITLAHRWLTHDPLNEQGWRQLMRLLLADGQRAAALAQYERCSHLLAVELGIDPAPETQTLYEQIKAGLDNAQPHDLVAPATPRHNLPAETTPFIGREAEMTAIMERLGQPTCRLLTLVGAGGMGKTRLALQTAVQQLGRFQHGVWFVALADVVEPEQMPVVMAETFGLALAGSRAPAEQLVDYLRQKNMLLLLDNMEQLIDESSAIDFLVTILQQAPAVKLLVTSRERLNVQAEWVVDVAGFAEAAEGVALFIQSAQQAQPGFGGTEVETAVRHICQQVMGMPLAIKLAAAWVPLLPLADISAEIEHNLDLLATRLRDVPRRQQSIRAVFASSWQRLSAAEQQLFPKLSLFGSSFSVAAAQAIMGCSLMELMELVDKSLVQRGGTNVSLPNGRLRLHPLLRQYSAEQLSPAAEATAKQDFVAYFAAQLAAAEPHFKSSRQQQILLELEPDRENIRLAWLWAVEAVSVAPLSQMIGGFTYLHMLTNRYREIGRWLQRLNDALPTPQTLAEQKLTLLALLWRTAAALELGNIKPVEQLLAQTQDLLETVDQSPLDGRFEKALFARYRAAYLNHFIGDFAGAIKQYQQSLAYWQALGDRWEIAEMEGAIGNVLWEMGDLVGGRKRLTDNVGRLRAVGNVRSEAIAEARLGLIDLTEGNLAGGIAQLQAAAAVFRERGENHMLASTLLNQGVGLGMQGLFDEAKTPLYEAQAIFSELGIFYDVGHINILLGWLELHLGHFAQAAVYGQGGIGLAGRSHYQRTVAAGWLIMGQAAVAQADHELAERYLQQSLSIYQADYERPDEIALVWATWAVAARAKGEKTAALSHLAEAVRLSLALDSFMEQVMALAAGVLLLRDVGELLLARRCYRVLATHAYFHRSAWFFAVVGKGWPATGEDEAELWSLREAVEKTAVCLGLT